jgi:phosphomannomutase
MIFDDQTWILLRLSGTEPVVCYHVEAHNRKDLDHLVDVARQFVFQE